MELLKAFLPVAGILFIILGLFSMRSKRQRKPVKPAREQLEELRQRKEVRNDLSRVMVEVEELTRRFSAQIDAKTIKLEHMIQEAEVRIDQLRQLEQRLETASLPRTDTPPHPTPSPEPASPPPTPTGSSMGDLRESVHKLADQGLEPADIAEKLDEHLGKIELILALRAPARD